MSLARLIGIDVSRMRRRGGIAAVAGAFAAVTVTLAIAFASFAGYIALARRYEMVTAALIVAGSLLLLALIGAVIAQQALKRAQREMRTAVSSSALVAFAPTAASMAARHTRMAGVAAAVGIGFWLARNAIRR